jgi:hypothetical protein
MTILSTVLQYSAAACAIAAAVFWFLAARVRLPTEITRPRPKDDLDQLTSGLRRQSRFNAIAGLFAGAAASLEVIVSYLD